MTNQEEFLKEVLALNNKPLKELKEKYEKLFGPRKSIPSNKTYLVKRIIYKMQELKHGGLSQTAKDKADTLIRKHDPINNTRSAKGITENKSNRDARLPIPGTIIRKMYKDKKLEVKVLAKGFEYKGKVYRSLSGIAKEVTGMVWNGFLFFGLAE
jgi:hypothetical protein